MTGYATVRLANIYGPGDNFDPATAMVIPALISRIHSGERPLTVWGDGSAVRDFLFSRDAAEGVILALHRGTNAEFVNIGSSAAVFRAIVEGKVDAGPSEAGFLEEQAKHGVHALSDGKMWEAAPAYTNQASYASTAAIAGKRDALVKALAAHARLYRFLHDAKSRDAYAAAHKEALKQNAPACVQVHPGLQQFR